MSASRLRRFASPYLVAILAISLTLVLRLALTPWLGLQMAPMMFFMAILAAACFGGWRAGLLATALGALVVVYFFLEPFYSFAIPHSGDRFQVFLFVIFGAAVSLVADVMLVTRRQSERQARMLDQAHDAVFAWEIGGPIVYWNRGAERLYGIGPQQAFGRVSQELLATAFPGTLDVVLVALTERGEWSGELTHRTVNAGRVVVESRMALIEEPDGRRLVLESDRDITARKRVEQALQESHERFQRALESIPDVVVIYDRDLRIQYINKATRQLTGRPVTDYIGKRDEEVWPPEVYEAYLPTLREAFQTRTIRALETNVFLPGRGTRSLQITCVPLIDDEGGIREVLVITHDDTERRAREQEIELLNRLYATLSKLNQSIVSVMTREELFQEVCRIAVAHAGFKLVWVGWRDPETHAVIPVARAGDCEGYLDGIKVYADDRPEGRGPVGVCMREGKPCIFQDFVNDPRAVLWREAAMIHGLRSVAALPIRFSGEVGGVFTVYAGELGVFQDKEISLLQEAAASISFALDHLEQEEKRRQAENSLRDREAQYRALIETTADGFWMSDAEGRLLEVNDAYVHPSGYSRTELLGMRISDLEAQEKPEETAAHIRRIILEGSDLFQSLHRRKDGTVWPVEVNITYCPSAGGRFFCFLRDITGRKRAEDEIRTLNASLELMVARRTAELESMLANATIGLAFYDRDFRFLRINHCLAQINGIPLDAHRGRSLRELLPEIAETVEPIVRRIFETGRPFTGMELQGTTPARPGERRTWLVSYYPVLAADGTVISVGATVTEITERKRAEEELVELNRVLRQEIAERERVEHQVRRLATILEASTDLVGMADPEGHVNYLNRSFSEALGRSPDREPLTIRDCHPEEAFHIIEQEGLPTAARLGVWRGETEFVTWDGRSFPTSQLILGHSDAQGSLQYYSTIMRDISERKQMEEALRLHGQELAVANAELARAARLKDEFLASMSHELRTPLNGVLAMSESLQEQVYGALNAGQRRAIRDIEECGRHLLALINDILDVAKIEAGKIEVEPGPIAVELFCQATIRLVKESAQQKRLRLSLQFDESVGILISDERRLKQILVNLLSNAVKFTPEGGEVALEVAGDRASRQVCFTVRDTGIGISPEDLARLFQPFVQLDSRLSRNYPGTGLGLALVKRLTTLLGGHTLVESQPGVGSRFTVVLPWIEESRATERESTLAERPGGDPRRADQPATEALVVVIEDNPCNAKGLCDYLCFKGFRVEWATNALDGIGLTQRLQPNLVVMDIQMPGMDGLDAIQRIRQLPAIGDVPIIALTALAMPGDRERCLKAGATDYIAKPVALDDFFRLATKLTAGT
jgi:PAS domain S-box-containing protein